MNNQPVYGAVTRLQATRQSMQFHNSIEYKYAWISPREFVIIPYWLLVNIDTGNGLVPSGKKPFPESVLTQIYVTIWHH